MHRGVKRHLKPAAKLKSSGRCPAPAIHPGQGEEGPGRCVDTTTLHVLLVVFFATLVRSTFGFGEALIAVPLLALMIPIGVAAPLAVLLSITIAAVVVVQDWRKIHVRSTVWLLAPTFVGIPLGVWLLTSSHPRLVKAALAMVIVA